MGRTISLRSSLRALLCVLFTAGLGLSPGQSAYAAAYTVNSLADTNDGACNTINCTLREAINAANVSPNADTIQFSLSGTITLASVLPGILTNSNLTIDGTGQTIRINGNDHDRVLWTNTNSDLTLKHLIIEEGYTTVSGGGVYSLGNLTVDNCTFSHNVADDYGGAIYSNGTLIITNSNLNNNSVNVANGGAIYVYTNTLTTISDSYFQENYAIISGGAIFSNGKLSVYDTDFLLNTADFGSGGAIYVKSPFEMDNLTLDQVFFSLNHAGRYGGGVYSYSGEFEISNTSFTFNQVDLDGGGMYVSNDQPSSQIKNSSFTNNSALQDGGAFFTLYGDDFYFDRVLFQRNHADQDGGAIYNSSGHAFVYHSTFDSNTAERDGGALYNLSLMDIHNDTFTGNEAVQNGGALYQGAGADTSGIQNSTFYDNNAVRGGGAYSLAGLVFNNCTFSGNAASVTGGAVYGDFSTGIGNSILASSTSGGNCDNEGIKPLDGGNNIDSGVTCGWGTTYGSKSNTNPLLGPLQLNGGATKTMALQAGSPAIDAVFWNAPNNCPEDDQRGYPRPFGLRCDIGAYERYYRLFMPQVRKY